ncbi:MAG: DUF4342 domain-containing protein [Tissierellia bacterium]|jgi:gas vesicle protein|nr:DUF4342 domain-containing protein [Tissierellia bacterium]
MKNITLEMIDEFIEETGFDYEEARAYLLAADGDVKLAVEAAMAKDGMYGKSSMDSLLAYIKELIKKGNILRVIIRKGDEVLLNIPAGVGVVGAFFATYLSAAALGVALITGHSVTLEKKDGDVINVQDYLEKAVKKAKDSGENIEDLLKKGVKESKDFAKDLKENIEDKFSDVKDKVESKGKDLKEETEDAFVTLKDEAEEMAETAKDQAREVKEKVEDKGEDLKENAEDLVETLKEEVVEAKEKLQNKKNIKEETNKKVETVKEEAGKLIKDLSESPEEIVELREDFCETIDEVKEGAGGLYMDAEGKIDTNICAQPVNKKETN